MKLNDNGAMVVLSGGQDSTTCLGWALENFKTVAAVTFDYGQLHKIEIDAARSVVKFFRDKTERFIPHQVVTMGDTIFAGVSPLTNPEEQLELYADHDQMAAIIGDRIERTFVPMRNAVFLMLAANRAVATELGHLVTGVCQEDNANYPDCRRTFINSAENAINEALGLSNAEQEFIVHTPLMNLTKGQTVDLARKLPHTYEALAFSHTAYDGKYPPTGRDHASILREKGFLDAGVPDPLVVRAWREGLMSLPETPNYKELHP